MKAVLIAAVLLGGCGFHLRGYDLSSTAESIFVASEPPTELAEALERNLAYAGVDVAADAQSAEAVVEILDTAESRRTVSVTSRARAADYRLTVSTTYRAVDARGREIIAPRSLSADRVYRIDQNNLVGSREEQALIRRELTNDLVQQIIRSLDIALAADDADPAG